MYIVKYSKYDGAYIQKITVQSIIFTKNMSKAKRFSTYEKAENIFNKRYDKQHFEVMEVANATK